MYCHKCKRNWNKGGFCPLCGEKLDEKDNTRSEIEKSRLRKKRIFFCLLLLLSIIVIVFNKYYVLIFNVENDVRQITRYLLIAYAFVAPVKVQNMILGGILRSGGKTTYVMTIDLIGTWIFGVPLGLLSAFVFRLPIAAVYFILSMEECIRVIMSLMVFRKKNWMQKL